MSNRDIFSRNLRHQMELHNRSRQDISDALGISYFTITSWVNGSKYPRMNKVEQLAKYFGILISDLVEEKVTEEKEKDNDILANIIVRMRTDEKFSSVVESIYNMEPSKLDAVSQMLETLKAFGK